jgi:hypothetical protein
LGYLAAAFRGHFFGSRFATPQPAKPAARYCASVLSLFLRSRLAILYLPGRYIDDQLRELSRVARALETAFGHGAPFL